MKNTRVRKSHKAMQHMGTTPERFLWACEILQINPCDHILEIGCGAGLLAELIADQLETGKLIAIDKSASMVEKARKRNRRHIDRGISEFIVTDFSNSDLPACYFDRIVAYNVNFFWKDPVKELQIIRKLLKKEGKLYILYQPPFEISISAVDPIKKKLTENAYTITDIQLKRLVPASAFCIIIKPEGNIAEED